MIKTCSIAGRPPCPNQPEIGERLLQRYREPHRRYHNVDHLRQVLTMIDSLADNQDLFLVRLAAWFHDAIYDIPPRELTNEEASARLAIRELGRAGLEQEDLTQVARLVRLTARPRTGCARPRGRAALRRGSGGARGSAGGLRALCRGRTR